MPPSVDTRRDQARRRQADARRARAVRLALNPAPFILNTQLVSQERPALIAGVLSGQAVESAAEAGISWMAMVACLRFARPSFNRNQPETMLHLFDNIRICALPILADNAARRWVTTEALGAGAGSVISGTSPEDRSQFASRITCAGAPIELYRIINLSRTDL